MTENFFNYIKFAFFVRSLATQKNRQLSQHFLCCVPILRLLPSLADLLRSPTKSFAVRRVRLQGNPQRILRKLCYNAGNGTRKRLKDNYEFPIAFIALHWRLMSPSMFHKAPSEKTLLWRDKTPGLSSVMGISTAELSPSVTRSTLDFNDSQCHFSANEWKTFSLWRAQTHKLESERGVTRQMNFMGHELVRCVIILRLRTV